MKKMSLLVMALVIALPGCRDKKKETTQSERRNSVARYMETPDGDEIIALDVDEDEDGTEDEDIAAIDFSDLDDEDEEEELNLDDIDAYLAQLKAEEDDQDFILDEADLDNQEEAFNWIDAQMDDELQKIYFSFNHYGLRPDQKAALVYDIAQVKELLAETDAGLQPTVIVEGHACQEGSAPYNLLLSEKRAKVIADEFAAAGISNIKVVGRGQECPVMVNGKVINGSRQDRAPNRRVEVRVIYT